MALNTRFLLCLISSLIVAPLQTLTQNGRVVTSPDLVEANYYLYHPQRSNQKNLGASPPTENRLKPVSFVTPLSPGQRSTVGAQSHVFVRMLAPNIPHMTSISYVRKGQSSRSLAVPAAVSDVKILSKKTRTQVKQTGQTSTQETKPGGRKSAEYFVKQLSASSQGRDILERLGIKQSHPLDSALVRRVNRVVYGLKYSASGRDLLDALGLSEFMGISRPSSASPGFLNRRKVLDFAPITLDYRNKAIDDLFVTAYGGLSNYGQEVLSIAPGYITTELDMCLTREQFNFMYHNRPLPRPMSGHYRRLPSYLRRYKRKAIKRDKYRWPSNVIPYVFNYDDFSWSEIMLIERSMYEWEERTCVRFRMKNARDVNYIRFRGGVGCSSHVGMIGGGQNVTLQKECRIKRIVLHEIGHAIGLIHEHQRPDRDDYIEIHYENASPGTFWDFEKRTWSSVLNYSVPYDYESVMHYGPKAFSKDGSKETIVTKDARFQNTIGKVTELSFYDIKVVNLMYNCNGHCQKGVACTNDGFLNRHCKCVCPKNKRCEMVKISRSSVQSNKVYFPWQVFQVWPWRVLGPVDPYNLYHFNWPNIRNNYMYRPNTGRII